MKRIAGIALLVLIFLGLPISGYTQKGVVDGSKYGHGEDSIRCIKNFSLYREYSKHKDYASAVEYWKVVFGECPKVSKNIYLDGVKIYRYLLKQDVTEERKNQLVDTLMLIYDQRIDYFGQKGNVRGRQGVELLKHRRSDDPKYIKQAYDYLSEAITLQKSKSSDPVLATYMSSSISLFKLEIFTEKQVIEDYLKVSEILSARLEKKPGDKRTTSLKKSIDDNFINDGPGNCETLIEYFSGEIDGKSDDIQFLEMLTTLLKDRDCTDSDLFFTAAKKLHELSPSAKSAVNIAIMSYNKGLFKETISYYQQAIEMETSVDKTADYHMGIAVSQQKLGDKSASRSSSLKAAKARPGYGDPYILIGQLYADSKDDCSSIEMPKSVYWLAVDMFKKAKSIDSNLTEKSNKLILTYSKYFPNKENAFFLGIHEGSTYEIGCWINEKTTARFQ